jgi:hypothetical protein
MLVDRTDKLCLFSFLFPFAAIPSTGSQKIPSRRRGDKREGGIGESSGCQPCPRGTRVGFNRSVGSDALRVRLTVLAGEHLEGLALLDRAITANSNSAEAYMRGGWVSLWNGDFETALSRVDVSERLDPHSTLRVFAISSKSRTEQAINSP